MPEYDLHVHTGIEDLNERQWNAVVTQTDHGSLFQRTEWLRAVENGIGLDPHHIVVERNGNPTGILPNFTTPIDAPVETPDALSRFEPRQLISTRPGFGGPLIISQKRATLDLIFEYLGEDCRGDFLSHNMRVLDTKYLQYAQYLERIGYRSSSMTCRIVVNLYRGWDDIQSNMEKSKRYDLKKSRELDRKVVDEDINKSNIDKFYNKYKKTMGRVDGVLYSKRFFDIIASCMSNKIKIFTAIVDEEPVGTLLCLLDENQASVHAFFSGVDEDHFDKYPNEILHEHAIKWALERDYMTYDFGESGANFANGSYKFKRRFGGEVLPVLSWERGHSPVQWNLFKLGRYFYRRYSDTLE
jgi:predicted N-acyltransferase